MPEYVYVLLNPAHMRYVKIGWTSKSPEERARELSAATGVPQPFLVAYEATVSDGPSAEADIHARLTALGHRLNPSREFFEIALKEAIAIVDQVCQEYQHAQDGLLHLREEQSPSPAEIAQLGWDYLNGTETLLQDLAAARECFMRAIELGGDMSAYSHLADMYLWGIGGRRNPDEAIRLLTSGGQKGFLGCYWILWTMFAGRAMNVLSGLISQEEDGGIETTAYMAHRGNAEVAFGWYLDGHSAMNVPVRVENLLGYLEWAHSQSTPGNRQLTGRHVDRVVELWVQVCGETLERLRQGRALGTPRSALRGVDSTKLELKPLLLAHEHFPKFGLSLDRLRPVMAACDTEDLMYAFDELPRDRAAWWAREFAPYLPARMIQTRVAQSVEHPSSSPAVMKPSFWSRFIR